LKKLTEIRRVSHVVPIIIIAAVIFSACAAVAQVQGRQLSKETQLKLLRLEEAKVSLQAEEDIYQDELSDLEDLKELYSEDVVTGKEVSDAETEVKDAARRLELAKIDLARTALSFLQESTHISITDAYQYIDTENNRHMSMTITNDSDLELAMTGLGEGIPEAGITKEKVPGLLTIEDLYVSIKVGSTVIGDPFEIKVAELPLHESVELDFKLNSQADEVSVSLKYHNQEDTRNIYLVKKSTEDIVRVSSMQFAQEGQLGTWVDFGIELERLAEDEATFTLSVLDLPDKFRYKFTDKGSQLSRVKFSQGVTQHSLVLKVNVPETLPSNELRKPISFFVIVGHDEDIAEIDNIRQEGVKVTEDELDSLKIGYERLEITPRGTGDFDISFNTLYYEIKVGDTIETVMTVKNTGTVKLSNIRFDFEAPFEWDVMFSPDEIDSIDPRGEEEINIEIIPPEDLDVGAYEIKFEGETEYEGSNIKSDEKNMKIQVGAKSNLSSNLMLVGGLIVFIMIMLVVTIRISRR